MKALLCLTNGCSVQCCVELRMNGAEGVCVAQVERHAEEARSAAEEAQVLQQELAAERAARENMERELAQLRVTSLGLPVEPLPGI
jgi:hypothetical protein